MPSIEIKENEKIYFKDAFKYMERTIRRTSAELCSHDGNYVFNNPHWGIEMQIRNRTFRLEMKLKEVE